MLVTLKSIEVNNPSRDFDVIWYTNDKSLLDDIAVPDWVRVEVPPLITPEQASVFNGPDRIFHIEGRFDLWAMKITALEGLRGYDKVLYLDGPDIIVQCDLNELFEWDMAGKLIAGVHDCRCREFDMKLCDVQYPGKDHSSCWGAINPGVVIFDMVNMPELPDLMTVAQDPSVVFADHDYLRIVFEGRIGTLPRTYNFIACRPDLYKLMLPDQKKQVRKQQECAKIIHYRGIHPWDWDSLDGELATYSDQFLASNVLGPMAIGPYMYYYNMVKLSYSIENSIKRIDYLGRLL